MDSRLKPVQVWKLKRLWLFTEANVISGLVIQFCWMPFYFVPPDMFLVIHFHLLIRPLDYLPNLIITFNWLLTFVLTVLESYLPPISSDISETSSLTASLWSPPVCIEEPPQSLLAKLMPFSLVHIFMALIHGLSSRPSVGHENLVVFQPYMVCLL